MFCSWDVFRLGPYVFGHFYFGRFQAGTLCLGMFFRSALLSTKQAGKISSQCSLGQGQQGQGQGRPGKSDVMKKDRREQSERFSSQDGKITKLM
jgi:hypothetical protein